MTPQEREALIAKAAEARKRAGLAYVEIRADESDAFVEALCHSTLESVASMEAARRGTRVMSTERRDALIKSAVQIRLDAGDPAGAHELELALRDASDAGLQARVTGELERGRREIAWQSQRRSEDARRDAAAVTEEDVAQAERDLEALRMDSRYASPHAKHDEDGHKRAIEMRARSLAKQRGARERLDAAQLAAPRVQREPEPAPDPFAPTLAPDPAWASRKGRRQ